MEGRRRSTEGREEHSLSWRTTSFVALAPTKIYAVAVSDGSRNHMWLPTLLRDWCELSYAIQVNYIPDFKDFM